MHWAQDTECRQTKQTQHKKLKNRGATLTTQK